MGKIMDGNFCFLHVFCVIFSPLKLPSCKRLLRKCKERGEIMGMNIARVDCFNVALIFLLFYFIFCILYLVLQFFCWPPLALMEKGDLTRNYCHDNCNGCFLMKLST